MNHNRTFEACLASFLLPLFAVPSIALAWSDTGHHVVGVVAYEAMAPSDRDALIEILSHHPQFDEHFAVPAGMSNPSLIDQDLIDQRLIDQGLIDRWRIGVAGCWPDIIRGSDYDRPTWHYQLGASVVMGDVAPPESPGALPAGATAETQELYLSQAVVLCVRLLADEDLPKSERAIALCWVLHLFADGHQPCHAGSLYAPIFPDGDRGANSIRFAGRGNLHAAWDGLLGGRTTPNDVRQRVFELRDVSVSSTRGKGWLRPETWLAESAALGRTHVYTDEVTGPVIAASRGLTDGMPKLKLSETYFKSAGEVARQRIKLAGLRLAVILPRCIGD